MKSNENALRDVFWDLEGDVFRNLAKALKAGTADGTPDRLPEQKSGYMRAVREAVATYIPEGGESLRDALKSAYEDAYDSEAWKDYAGKRLPGRDLRLLEEERRLGQTVAHLASPIITGEDREFDRCVRLLTEQYNSGHIKLHTAIDRLTEQAFYTGIKAVTYKDGKQFPIAAWGEMALRTGTLRARLFADGKRRQENGIHTVIASMRISTCDECVRWQGKVFIDDVFTPGATTTGDYPLLSEAMADGFLHPNCRHTISTYIPGTPKDQFLIDPNEAERNYKAEQKQRELERAIRFSKETAATSITPEARRKANAKTRHYQKLMREHLEKHPELERDRWREKTRNEAYD